MAKYQSERYVRYLYKQESLLVEYDSHLKTWTICIYDEWYIVDKKTAQRLIKAINTLNKVKESHNCIRWG